MTFAPEQYFFSYSFFFSLEILQVKSLSGIVVCYFCYLRTSQAQIYQFANKFCKESIKKEKETKQKNSLPGTKFE